MLKSDLKEKEVNTYTKHLLLYLKGDTRQHSLGNRAHLCQYIGKTSPVLDDYQKRRKWDSYMYELWEGIYHIFKSDCDRTFTVKCAVEGNQRWALRVVQDADLTNQLVSLTLVEHVDNFQRYRDVGWSMDALKDDAARTTTDHVPVCVFNVMLIWDRYERRKKLLIIINVLRNTQLQLLRTQEWRF